MLGLVNRLLDLAVRAELVRVTRVPGVRVISVGALTMGGAGKTPVAMAIAAAARDAGLPTAVVLRGYHGRAEGTGRLVSDGERILAGTEEVGDEAVLHARRLPGVMVRIGADRVEAVRGARSDGARLVVLDDGFQHRRLARDLDIVCVAPGLRREGDLALRRADLVVCAPGVPVGGPARPVVHVRVVPTEIVRGPALVPEDSLHSLTGARVALACAIARPYRFVRSVEGLGARVVAVRTRPDHETLRPEDLALPRGADLLLTTEKDAVKLGEGVRALRVEARLVTGPLPVAHWLHPYPSGH